MDKNGALKEKELRWHGDKLDVRQDEEEDEVKNDYQIFRLGVWVYSLR